MRHERPCPEDAVDEQDVDGLEEPAPEASLRAAGEQALRRGRGVRPSTLGSDAGDRLLRVLERIGRIDHVCHEQAGVLFAEDPEPREEWEREHLEESTRSFICWCADQLAETAALAVEFATALCLEVDDHKRPSAVVDELRGELMNEMAIKTAAGVDRRGVAASKRAVAETLEVDLRFAAIELATAAHELADSRWPAQAASSAVYLAARLLAVGERIADTVGYHGWPEPER